MSPDLRPGGRRRLKLHSALHTGQRSALAAPAPVRRRRLRLTLLAAAVLALGAYDGYLAGVLYAGSYGRPGVTMNGGIVVAVGGDWRQDCGREFGLELWGRPGPFASTDC